MNQTRTWLEGGNCMHSPTQPFLSNLIANSFNDQPMSSKKYRKLKKKIKKPDDCTKTIVSDVKPLLLSDL